ncbi:hypothetical protein AZH51_01470 [Branchiibius sp. NY16-3462-2]|nr:hypothetical protein AZH51_01470 [Branchiibius sp. NY16-3462-2]
MSRRAAILGGTGIAVVTATGTAAATDEVVTYRSPTYRVSPMPDTVTTPMNVRVTWHTDAPATHTAHLTFDDGPSPVWTPKVLDILHRHEATATFFMLHEFIKGHPDVVRQVHDAGHEIGVHGGDHTDMTTLEPAQLARILTETRHAITDLTGVAPTRMRPPYGRLDAPVLWAAHQAGLEEVVLWSHRTGGSRQECQAVLTHPSSGMIILSHDGRTSVNDAELDAISWLLPQLRAKGFSVSHLPLGG